MLPLIWRVAEAAVGVGAATWALSLLLFTLTGDIRWGRRARWQQGRRSR